MATISSHVLDAVRGDHAKGIRIECLRRENGSTVAPTKVFSVVADQSGRIAKTVEVDPDADHQFELVFHTAEYFSRFTGRDEDHQIMPEVVVRLTLTESDTKYHLPLVLSPHSYTVWWSGVSTI